MLRPRGLRLLLSTALFCAAALFGGAAIAQPGPLSGFGFLRLEPSARAAALGGAFSAVYGDDVNGLFFNPALLNEEMSGALSISYLNHLSDLNAGFLAYAHDFGDRGAFGAGLRFLSWGEIEGADAFGEPTGTFGASDVAVTLGGARAAANENLRYGANVHLVHSSIESYGATALAADLGVAYRLPGPRLTVSASVNNLGTTLSSFGQEADELPFDVRVGVSKRLRYVPLLISVTGYNLQDVGDPPADAPPVDQVLHYLALGGEFQFSESFQVRLGYNHRRHESLKTKSRLDLAGFAAGFGLKVTRVRFDYAYSTWSSAGGLHQITLRTRV